MDDLQLLELLEKAKDKQKGPKGDPGVGIDKVEQFDGNSFTLRLTDGSFKKIDLQPGANGEAGAVGPVGAKGDQGVAGRDGGVGATGQNGADGVPGRDGSFVDTAVVNSSGDLLLSLSTGEILNVGRVVGPAGATGASGPTGLPGNDGEDGEAVLSGPRAPQSDDGKNGDHWIDISSAEFSFYKKSGDGWSKLANLRQPAKEMRVGAGAGGAAGGGGSGGADIPPVIINLGPPSNGNNNKPVRQGDLWFDSDQLALYVATKNSSNKIVWVICIPGVTGVPGTQAASVPVIWPVAVDGEEWVNPLTQVTYVFNAPKKQWINVNGGIVSVQDKPPLTPQTGALWFNTEEEELTLYIYNGYEWVDAGYVKTKGGDSMEGQLIINGPRKAGDDVDNPKLVSSLKVLSIDNAQNSSLQLRHSGNAKVYVGDTDISIASDIKFNRAAGSVVKTNVQDLLNIGESEIAYLGRSIEDEDLITKKYVDDAKEFLQNEIIELEEEIDAIAPSVERGRWSFTAVGTVGQPGQFTMYDDDFGNGSPTGLFKSAKSVWFNELDIDGTPHAFGDVADGELLEIFIDGSPEFGLFSVIGDAHDETQSGTKFWVIDVNFVRTNEATTSVGPGELCRFKIFMAPTGGDASAFVLKSGDKMTGDLTIDRTTDGNTDVESRLTIEGSRPSSTNAAAVIKFINDQTNDSGFLTYRSGSGGNWFAFNRDLDLNNNGLHSAAQIRLKSGGYIGAGSSSRIKINNGSDSEAGTEIQRAGDNRRTFSIRGKTTGSNTVEDFFWAYGNSESAGDAINYTGLTTQGNHIVNKTYVDDRMAELLAKIEELEMGSIVASEVGRNLKGTVLADTRTSVAYGYVGPVNSNSNSINISIPGVSIAPRGQITLREDSENDGFERFTFNILDATNTGNDTKGARWNVKVVLDGATDKSLGYGLRTNRRRTEVGLLNGAWSQEPVSGAVKFKVYSDDIVESGAVTDPLKAYALDEYGNLDTNVDGYAYGLFIPLEYFNTIARYEADGDIDGQMMRVYGTTESSKGIIERITVTEERMVDAEYNGVKGIKAWAFSRFSANTRVDITMTNVLITRAPDRDHELNEYSVDEGSVADASSDDE